MFHTCLLSDVVHFARAYPPLLDRILLISSSGGIIIYPPIFLLSKSKSLRKEEVKIKRLPIYSNLAEEEECTIPVYSLHQVGNKPGEFPIKTCPLRIPEIPRSHHEFETSTYTRIYIYTVQQHASSRLEFPRRKLDNRKAKGKKEEASPRLSPG